MELNFRESFAFVADIFTSLPRWIEIIIGVIVPPIIIGILVYLILWFFLHYKRQKFILGMDFALLEVKIPREVYKTPMAMELVLTNSMYQHSRKGWNETWLIGPIRFYYSLEIVSLGGQVHFYIRTPTNTKDLVETQIYAQYPQAEIFEVEDYTNYMPEHYHKGGYEMWGCEFRKTEHDAFPIKTYVDYGMDKPGAKPHEAVDPLTPALELMSSVKPGDQMWMQIIIRASYKRYKTRGKRWATHEFPEEVTDYYKYMLKDYRRVNDNKGGPVPFAIEYRVPDFLKTKAKALDRATEKLPFDVGIRCLYISPKDKYDNQMRRAMRTIFRQYKHPDLNELGRTTSTQYDYPWRDPTGNFLIAKKQRFYTQYRNRTYFYPRFENSFKYPWPIQEIYSSEHPVPSVLNTEEIATIFHFPSRTAETPGIERIESKTSEPPINLPT